VIKEMADKKKLPREMYHGGHFSRIDPIDIGGQPGSFEIRIDGEGNLMDGFVTVEGGKGRRKVL